MRSSLKNINHAYEVMRDFNGYISELKKYALINELDRYGVNIKLTSELEFSHLKDIYYIVLKRIVDKYNYDGSIK